MITAYLDHEMVASWMVKFPFTGLFRKREFEELLMRYIDTIPRHVWTSMWTFLQLGSEMVEYKITELVKKA